MIVEVHTAHSSRWHCLEIKSWHTFMKIVEIKSYMYIFYTFDLISATIKTCCCFYFSFKKFKKKKNSYFIHVFLFLFF